MVKLDGIQYAIRWALLLPLVLLDMILGMNMSGYTILYLDLWEICVIKVLYALMLYKTNYRV